MTKKSPDEIEVRYYEDDRGRQPFARFFKRIGGMAAVKITAAVTRLRAGNTGDSKSVGKGVSELRIDWGLVTDFITDGMAQSLSFCCPAVLRDPKNSSQQTSRKLMRIGPTIKSESERRRHNATFKRIQRTGGGTR